MLKFCLSAATAALIASPLLADGLTFGRIKATTFRGDGGKDASFTLETAVEVTRARLTYTFSASFEDELQDSGAPSGDHRASFSSGFDYAVTESVSLGAEISRTATESWASTSVAVGGRYRIGPITTEAAYVHHSTDLRYAQLLGLYTPTTALTIGARASRTWLQGTDNSARTTFALAGRYDADPIELTGYADHRNGGDNKRLALVGTYEVNDAVALLAGLGTHTNTTTTFRQAAIGLRYHATQQISINALYAISHETQLDTNTPQIGIGIRWDFGKSAYANTAFNAMRDTALDTISAYSF